MGAGANAAAVERMVAARTTFILNGGAVWINETRVFVGVTDGEK